MKYEQTCDLIVMLNVFPNHEFPPGINYTYVIRKHRNVTPQ